MRTLAFPFQRIDAAGRHQDLVAALVEFGAVIFHRRRKCRMRLPGFRQIDRALGRSGQRRFVDLEARDLAAKHRIFKAALLIGAKRVSRDLAQRTTDAAFAHARDHRALVLEQIFRHIPAAIDRANHVALRHPDIVEKRFAER